MKRSTLAIAAYLMLVFGSGIVVGAFGHRLYTAREVSAARLTQPQGRMNPKDFRRKYSEELKTRLNLDAKQQATLQEILNDTEVRFREHNARTRPEAEKIKQHQREQIRAMLTPSQLPEYENILVERSRRSKDRK